MKRWAPEGHAWLRGRAFESSSLAGFGRLWGHDIGSSAGSGSGCTICWPCLFCGNSWFGCPTGASTGHDGSDHSLRSNWMPFAALCLLMSLWTPFGVLSWLSSGGVPDAASRPALSALAGAMAMLRCLCAPHLCKFAAVIPPFRNWIYLLSVITSCFRPPFSSAIMTTQTQYKPEKTWKEH